MIKSITKYSSLALFSLMLIIGPIQQAQALAPYAAFPEFSSLAFAASGGGSGAEATIATLAAAGGSSANPVGVGFAAMAVGLAAGHFSVQYVCDSGAVDACKVRQPLSNKSIAQIPAPDAPVTSGTKMMYSFSAGAADTACGAYYLTSGNHFSCTSSSSSSVFNGGLGPYACSAPNSCLTAASGISCIAGYTLSGSTCNLTNARLATSDGNVDLTTNGNASSINADKDTMATNKKPVISTDGTDVKYAGYVTGADGQKHMIWVDVQKQNTADATADLYQMEVSYIEHNLGACATDLSCQSLGSTPQEITTQKILIANGVVVGTSASTKTGNIASTGDSYTTPGGSTGTVQPGELVVTTPDTTGKSTTPTQVTTDTPVQPKTQTLTLPTDYARQGEAQTAANTVRDKLAESDPQTDLVEPTLTNPLVDYFNPLRAWSYPTVQGVCPFGSFTWNEHVYSFEAGCTLFNDNLVLIKGAMSVLYALAALFIVLGA